MTKAIDDLLIARFPGDGSGPEHDAVSNGSPVRMTGITWFMASLQSVEERSREKLAALDASKKPLLHKAFSGNL
jgi:hypothetical protein